MDLAAEPTKVVPQRLDGEETLSEVFGEELTNQIPTSRDLLSTSSVKNRERTALVCLHRPANLLGTSPIQDTDHEKPQKSTMDLRSTSDLWGLACLKPKQQRRAITNNHRDILTQRS